MLFGNFMELLDDLVPGMRAEMLNDRGFDGITRSSNWCYYEGETNICDREWEQNDTWHYDTDHSFNGTRSAKLTARSSAPAHLAQSDLAVGKKQAYIFSATLWADKPGLKVEVILKAKLPDGKWMILGYAKLPSIPNEWRKCRAMFVSNGVTDRAVFELKVSGAGNLWADKLSLMPTDNADGWRMDVVAAIKEMKPSIIRWGGSVCDPGGYRWKKGIGDPDSRVPFANTVWGRIDSSDVGIDEFCRFCELVKAEPLVCLSFSDGAQSAADLVHYCNDKADTRWGARRAANGHPKPYGVKYWQLGNELGNNEYVNDLPAFCEAMKNADPSVILMASFPSQELLDKVGTQIGYIGPHHYTPDFTACEADFKNLTNMIENTPGCEQIKIGVTEWNVSGGSWGIMRGKFPTLETALLNAKYLNLLMRYSDIVNIACRSNMTNSLGSGVIETRPSGLMKRPSYYVMKLYAEQFKPVPVRIKGTLDGVDLFACCSEDGDSLCLFAVNMKADPVELSLDTSEYGDVRLVEHEVICDTLDARQLDLMNHWSTPQRVMNVKQPSADKLVLPAFSASAIEFAAQATK